MYGRYRTMSCKLGTLIIVSFVAGRVRCTHMEPGVKTCARARMVHTATAWTAPARAAQAGWAPAVPSLVNRENMVATAGQIT